MLAQLPTLSEELVQERLALCSKARAEVDTLLLKRGGANVGSKLPELTERLLRGKVECRLRCGSTTLRE